jgi:hypothetical protein
MEVCRIWTISLVLVRLRYTEAAGNTTSEATTMDLDKPIRFSEPSYDWEPEHGSYGCEPRVSRGFTKSATDNDGGNYPVQNDNTREKLREVLTLTLTSASKIFLKPHVTDPPFPASSSTHRDLHREFLPHRELAHGGERP